MYDSLTMLATLLDLFVMIFNNKKSLMVHYLATAGLLLVLGQTFSFFTKITFLSKKCLVSSEYVINRFNHTHYVPGSFYVMVRYSGKINNYAIKKKS